jgi:signal transduction histidine kinase
VSDDGRGFDVGRHERRDGGIRGMRERALLIGAELLFDSRPGAGTQVVLEVSLDRDSS